MNTGSHFVTVLSPAAVGFLGGLSSLPPVPRNRRWNLRGIREVTTLRVPLVTGTNRHPGNLNRLEDLT